MKESPTADGTKASALTVNRIFDAPPELVFNFWCDPEHVKRW